jgi:hypothetical protein
MVNSRERSVGGKAYYINYMCTIGNGGECMLWGHPIRHFRLLG